MGIYSEYNKRRDRGNQNILGQEFLPYKRFFNLDTNAYKSGKIPSKYKELMGLTGSLMLRCNDCVLYHLEKCHSLGVSIDELNEAMNISLVIGGSIVIPHLRFAYDAIEELYQ